MLCYVLLQVESSGNAAVRFVSFDFHKECKGMKYQNLSKLVDECADELPAMASFDALYTPLADDQAHAHAQAQGGNANARNVCIGNKWYFMVDGLVIRLFPYSSPFSCLSS